MSLWKGRAGREMSGRFLYKKPQRLAGLAERREKTEDRMKIRLATEDEMVNLWKQQNINSSAWTMQFFCDNLRSGNADFWTMEDQGQLLGELYVFHRLEDTDFADGRDRVYLCAFRIRKDMRGQGLGTRLITEVLGQLKASGCKTVTIGVDAAEDANIRLYRRLGFLEKIKDCYEDPCARDEKMQYEACSCFWLLKKSL